MTPEHAVCTLEKLAKVWSTVEAECHHLKRVKYLRIYEKAGGLALDQAFERCGISPDDTILEIGSGDGALRRLLLTSKNYSRLKLIESDISRRRPNYEAFDLREIIGTNRPLPGESNRIVGFNLFYLFPVGVQRAIAQALAERDVHTVVALCDLRPPIDVALEFLMRGVDLEKYVLFPSFESFFGQFRPEGWLILPNELWPNVKKALDTIKIDLSGVDLSADTTPQYLLKTLEGVIDSGSKRYIINLCVTLKRHFLESAKIEAREFYIKSFIDAYQQAGFADIQVFSVRQPDPEDPHNPVFFYYGDFVDLNKRVVLADLPKSSGVALTVCCARRPS